MKILTIADKKEEKFLRTKTADFDFTLHNKKETDELIKKMRNAMLKANGIGLSANQIGLNMRLFIAQIPQIQTIQSMDKKNRRGRIDVNANANNNRRKSVPGKFYAIFNPAIVNSSKKTAMFEEGCLSVPGIYGPVERPEKIVLTGLDKNGRNIKIKTKGLLARVFQHEIDHLNGMLFIDKAINLYKYKMENIESTNRV